MSASLHSVRASIVSGVSASSSSSGKSRITRSTGRGGAGNIKRAVSHDPLAPIFTLSLNHTHSEAGREAPVSPTTSKTTRSTGRGGSGNIARARARSTADSGPLPAQTKSIVEEYERARAKKERDLIENSTAARRKNIGASGRGGAGNNYLKVKSSSASSKSSMHTPFTTTVFDDDVAIPPVPSLPTDHDLAGSANPRYKPRASIWSKFIKKDHSAKRGDKGKARTSLHDSHSVLDIAPEPVEEGEPGPSEPTRRAAHVSYTPSTHRRGMLFASSPSLVLPSEDTEAYFDEAGSSHTLGVRPAWSPVRSEDSGSTSTVSIIASSDSASIYHTEYAGPSRPHRAGAPPAWLWAETEARERNGSVGSIPMSRASSWMAGRGEGSMYSRTSRETGHTFGSAPAAVSTAPSVREAPATRPGHIRIQTEASTISEDDGARDIRRVGRLLFEPSGFSERARPEEMTVPSTLTLSLVPPSSARQLPPSPRAPTYPIPAPPLPSYLAAEDLSDEDTAVDPMFPAPWARHSFSPSVVPSRVSTHPPPPTRALPSLPTGPTPTPRSPSFHLPHLVLPARTAPSTWPDAPVTDRSHAFSTGPTPSSLGVPQSVRSYPSPDILWGDGVYSPGTASSASEDEWDVESLPPYTPLVVSPASENEGEIGNLAHHSQSTEEEDEQSDEETAEGIMWPVVPTGFPGGEAELRRRASAPRALSSFFEF